MNSRLVGQLIEKTRLDRKEFSYDSPKYFRVAIYVERLEPIEVQPFPHSPELLRLEVPHSASFEKGEFGQKTPQLEKYQYKSDSIVASVKI